MAMGLIYIDAAERIQQATRSTGLYGLVALVLFNVVRGWGGPIGLLNTRAQQRLMDSVVRQAT